MLYFLLGCLTSIVIVAILKVTKQRIQLKKLPLRQSTLYHIVDTLVPQSPKFKKVEETQSRIFSKRGTIRFIQAPDNKAYWIDNNVFYCAEIVDGEFDPSAGKPVDTINASKQDINKLLFILDSLRNG